MRIDASEGKEFKFGDKVTFSSIEGSADCFVQTNEWDSLFEDGESVFVARGDLALKVVGRSADVVELEVAQGGKIFDGMEIYIPATKKPVLVDDIPEETSNRRNCRRSYFTFDREG